MFKKLSFISTIIFFIMITQLNALGLSASQESSIISSNYTEDSSVLYNSTVQSSDNCFYYPYTGIDDPHPIKENTKIYNKVYSYPDINAYGFYPTNSTSFVLTINGSDSVKIQISDIDGSTLYEFNTKAGLENKFYLDLPSQYFYPINIIGYSSAVDYNFEIIPANENIIEITEGNIDEGTLTDNQSVYYCFIPELSGAYTLDIYDNFKYNTVVLKDKNEEIKSFFGYYILDKNTKYYIKLSNKSEYTYSTYYFSIKFVAEDFGNTMSNSLEIKTNENVYGSLFVDQDIDYYYFVPEVSGMYKLHTRYRFDATILNNLNEEIESVDEYFLLKGNEGYFVKISKQDQIEALPDYEFSIEGPIDDYVNEKEYSSKIPVGTCINGNLSFYQDVDSFYIIPEKTGTYELTLASDTLDSLLTKTIFDEYNRPINTLSGYYIFEENQKYYIQISERGDFEIPVNYNFTISGPIEEDVGDDFNDASMVEIGSKVTGSFIYNDDIDYYYFIPQTGGAYKLDISINESGNKFNPPIVHSNYGEIESINEYYLLEENEKYYIGFCNYGILDSFINYEFSVSGPYAEDNGNDISKAVRIETGVEITGSLIFDSDIDFYCLIPKKSGAYKPNILGKAFEPKYYNLTIIDSSENPIEILGGYYYLTENKEYYIKLFNGDYEKLLSNYNFSITGPLEEDYGDTISTSKSVNLNQRVQGSIYSHEDCDVFSFTAPSKFCYIRVDGAPNEAISLYDSSNELVNYYERYSMITMFESPVINDLGIHTQESMYFSDLHIGDTYYLKIGGNTDPVEYNFIIESLDDDYGNSPATAQTVNEASPITGKINYSNDQDFFKFIPEVSYNYTLSLLGDSSVNVNVMNSATDILPSSVCLSDCSGVNYALEKGETYYIAINGSIETNYTLTINKPIPEVKIGDINGDDNVNAIDFANLRMYLLGMIDKFPSPSGHIAADINSDGAINSIDFAILRQYLLGIISSI